MYGSKKNIFVHICVCHDCIVFVATIGLFFLSNVVNLQVCFVSHLVFPYFIITHIK